MSRYVLSPAARADLEQIWHYTYETWDGDQAEKYVREIQRAIERVVDNPMTGRACDEIRPGYRKHPVGSHTLYYRIAGADMIDVVRILHQRMDVDRQLD
ncbi:toxin ParE1 [Mycobacterium kansasii 732]|uniref:Toxin n=1 Tax=Mycobacterium pseudokansasii TaxID=2341080 RepID=A0A498QHZ8_9MYCO|nr:type II toxin-antitoxin system RelE/ParE family toxin [Mycobacterium pseudokansasii]EUA07957.1 toxin ParE1 [Mycobacterium kansasii 732]KZS65725.1 plasmid stabilization protein ParE [Mycobacterium kansasii]MBY0389569.1 type II toxin-antitoxin system RelE/ParE family toxin [Mycobacterium pseudokansasii]VAZ87448.1 Toxin ParE1 [Mycobacterium pseudokansasii]VAZ87836.1 Toxin ParE1 [Mycobacterium pseudokansasii]